MPLRIVRNDITKMNTEAIVNTANDHPTAETGCDHAVYKAAGYDELLKYRQDNIGYVPEGDAFITPGFALKAKFIIHAVSPRYIDGEHGEEGMLRLCYKKSLALAKENDICSISFPLISSGGFGYPREEAMRIAVDEINTFLLSNEMLIFLVVFDSKSAILGEKIYPGLEAYIDHNYVRKARAEEYGDPYFASISPRDDSYNAYCTKVIDFERRVAGNLRSPSILSKKSDIEPEGSEFSEEHESRLEERMQHLTDTFSEYLMYLISCKGMENAEVWKRAIIDKKVFSKIKNDRDYHPQKLTALCLCVGVKLNLDESKDLLARAGYALSPCDKTDVIFSFFIENEIYDMIEIDIQLEEHGLPCIIT
ncbi:MAG: macro domain-containing protein [Lachnospiraceae bacterium]|nr:macro domain-containing protein [Lachnospiraceae bacterium]